MSFNTETVSIKLPNNAIVHTEIRYGDAQDDAGRFTAIVTLKDATFGAVVGNPQYFTFASDGVVTNVQTNSIVAWVPGTEPNANVPTRLANFIQAVQSLFHALNLNNQISGAPRG